MDVKEIEKLIEIIQDSKLSELVVTVGDSTVRLRKPLGPAPKPAPRAKAKSLLAEVEEALTPAEPSPDEVYVTAPMVGIFHGIDAIGAIESAVKAGQVVGVIESMKLMNDVVCECDGMVEEILIEDDMPVEYGQRLLRLRKS